MKNGEIIQRMPDEQLAVFLSEWAKKPWAWKQDPGETLYWLRKHNGEGETAVEQPEELLEGHSETEIVKGCIALMQELTGRFEEYLDFMNVTPENDEERFTAEFTYFGIVQRLLLWTTHHSGGTSTMEKCRELGFDSSDTVTFEDERGRDDE